MTYIYDVLLNFNDDERLLEFFEWNSSDVLEHYKKINLIRITRKQMEDILNYKIKVSEDFLHRIKNTSISYSKNSSSKYAILVSDLNKVIGLDFNNKGEIISKSSLLLDEEEDIIDECYDLYTENIPYEKIKKYKKELFLTREEEKKKKYLLKELEILYQDRNIDKLNYLYEELFSKDDLSFENKYLKIKESLEKEYSNKHSNLYDIVRLSYIKK